MKGWIIHDQETLKIAIINDVGSLLNGTISVPHVLQNQLDHKLEQEVIRTERKLLKELQRVMKLRNRYQWSIFILSKAIVKGAGTITDSFMLSGMKSAKSDSGRSASSRRFSLTEICWKPKSRVSKAL
jgi:hypothetical protein